jgi:hypothetical protein
MLTPVAPTTLPPIVRRLVPDTLLSISTPRARKRLYACTGAADKVKLGNLPSTGDRFRTTLSMGIEIFVCEASKQMLGWDKVQLISGVKIVGAATLNDLILEADGVVYLL